MLSGDNALVIAMVMRGLPPAQRRRGIWIGTLGAVVMRIGLTLGAWRLLEVPGLRLAGGLTLLWMGWRLATRPEHDSGAATVEVGLALAIRQVMWADAVMSADNVLAVAGAARGQAGLLILGIATSIPLVAVGSGLIGRLLDRFPLLVVAGGVLLGWVGGELASGEPWLAVLPAPWRAAGAPACALAVLALILLSRRRRPAGGAVAAQKHRL